MEAALAELALQNLEPEPEDDDDFAGPDGDFDSCLSCRTGLMSPVVHR